MSKDYRKSIVRNYERLFARSNIKRLSEKDKKIFKNHLFARDEYFDKSHERCNAFVNAILIIQKVMKKKILYIKEKYILFFPIIY